MSDISEAIQEAIQALRDGGVEVEKAILKVVIGGAPLGGGGQPGQPEQPGDEPEQPPAKPRDWPAKLKGNVPSEPSFPSVTVHKFDEYAGVTVQSVAGNNSKAFTTPVPGGTRAFILKPLPKFRATLTGLFAEKKDGVAWDESKTEWAEVVFEGKHGWIPDFRGQLRIV